jgi:hypothetical protein
VSRGGWSPEIECVYRDGVRVGNGDQVCGVRVEMWISTPLSKAKHRADIHGVIGSTRVCESESWWLESGDRVCVY